MNTKIIAVIAIVVVVAAGCGTALLVMNNGDNDKPYRSSDMTGRLAVMREFGTSRVIYFSV